MLFLNLQQSTIGCLRSHSFLSNRPCLTNKTTISLPSAFSIEENEAIAIFRAQRKIHVFAFIKKIERAKQCQGGGTWFFCFLNESLPFPETTSDSAHVHDVCYTESAVCMNVFVALNTRNMAYSADNNNNHCSIQCRVEHSHHITCLRGLTIPHNLSLPKKTATAKVSSLALQNMQHI